MGTQAVGPTPYAGAQFDPGYGHIPPLAFSQLVAPWLWHGAGISADELLEQQRFARYPAGTNKVEAHLYAGSIPLLLACCLLFRRRNRSTLFACSPWILIGGSGLLLATGWPLVLLKSLPGFGFFMGPGRYGILAALSIALLAGAGWDRLFGSIDLLRKPRRWSFLLAFCVTIVDLWAVSREYVLGTGVATGRQVFYASLVDQVPIDFQHESRMEERLLSQRPVARLYAPGANIPSLLGISSLPVYLGLGPQIYFEPEQQIDFTRGTPEEIAAIAQRLRDWGVTHLFLQSQIDPQLWPVSPAAHVGEPTINRAFGRMQPFYLYALREAPGRARLDAEGTIESLDSSANRVAIDYNATTDCRLTLVDLNYPGWQATIDGKQAEMVDGETFRVLKVPAGRHSVVWIYQPRSLQIGAAISLASLLLLLLLSTGRFGLLHSP